MATSLNVFGSTHASRFFCNAASSTPFNGDSCPTIYRESARAFQIARASRELWSERILNTKVERPPAAGRAVR